MTTIIHAPAWTAGVLAWLAGQPENCACAIVFPSYRPDLVEQLATAANARFCDYRKLKMAPLGWQAANLTLDILSSTAEEEMDHGKDVVLHNVEAMLSLVTREKREWWLEQTAVRAWPRRLILPLTLYAHDLPACMIDHVHELQAAALPGDGVLQRVAGLR